MSCFSRLTSNLNDYWHPSIIQSMFSIQIKMKLHDMNALFSQQMCSMPLSLSSAK